MSGMTLGIDVSDNQGVIDWRKARAAGVGLAVLRTTRKDGSSDRYLSTNIKGCLDNGIPMGFYKYSYATTEGAAREEARGAAGALRQYGVLPSKSTRLFMDVEDKSQIALSTPALTGIVEAFRDTVVGLGYSFGLYMGKYCYECGEVDLSSLSEATWIARYYAGDRQMDFGTVPDGKYAPTAKSGTLVGWQFTSRGRVDGISGNVDLNAFYGEIGMPDVEASYYAAPEFTLVDSLNKVGADSSYASRKRIAAANGIEGYSGTAEQNLRMLELLRSGKLVRA